MKYTKQLTLTLLGALFMLVVATCAQAVFLACFNQGNFIDFCNPAVPDRTAPTDFYFICMSEYITESGCYVHAGFNACNTLPPDNSGQCGGTPGNTTIDSTPPVLTIFSPLIDNSSVFSSTSVVIDYSVDERSDIYYKNLDDGRDRFVKICDDCTGAHQKIVRMKEGENNFQFRAVDVVGNLVSHDVQFFVDSKEPRITTTNPTRGFADGTFTIEYIELNPESLFLFYGNASQQVDLNTCTEVRSGRMACETFADLSLFDGSDILYWFNLTDIAGNSEISRVSLLTVDATNPIIEDLSYVVDGRSAKFTLNITEPNFDKVAYLDDKDTRGRWKTLCSRLSDGICSGRATLVDGFHTLTLNVTDEAGNSASEEASFFVDSRKPRISKTEPRSGFADGNFYVELDEANPVSLFLEYGNTATGMNSVLVDLENDCNPARRGSTCSALVDVSPYHGQEIDYWFNVTDVVGQSASSRVISLDVDTVFPIVNEFNYTVDGRRVAFFINVSEENFDSIEYRDNGLSRPRFRSLCSRLSDGICERTLTFSTGIHEVDVQITDKAGNAISEQAIIEII